MSGPVRFGTDGIRGRAYDDISLDLAYRLGWAVGTVFRVPVVVGCDTRASSPDLTRAVLAGLRDAGAVGINLGVFTTPGVAVIAQLRGGAGVVVSASHNPYYDNGLKVLGLGGTKLDYATEQAVEAAMGEAPAPSTNVFAEVPIDEQAQHEYVAHLRRVVPRDLTGLHLVLDCAHGAASDVAHELFEGTGAQITTLHDQPDGHNINKDCGSTHPEKLQQAVRDLGADLGLAFDGDADRLIAVDARGALRDGDDLLVLFSLDALHRDDLPGVVVTSMSNLGLHRALGAFNIDVVETDVGDRNVLVALEENGWHLGGEQSGHIIFRRVSPTGDGLLTGLLLADLVERLGPLDTLCDAAWERVPQLLINVPNDHYDDDAVRAIFASLVEQHDLDDESVRLLIRPSGTEPLVRIMIESTSAEVVETFAQRVTALGAR